METPAWGLTIAYWLHMIATAVWIGGLAALGLFVLPAARKTLDTTAYAAFLISLQRRFEPLGWFSLLILAGTGLFQMSASPNYQGFLSIENRWAAAILIKHLVFIGMTLVSAYLTWGLLPELRRLAMLHARQDAADDHLARLEKRERRLLQLNLALGIIILALTAVARAA